MWLKLRNEYYIDSLKKYLFEHEIITGDQFAYRSGHSTETALHGAMLDHLDGANDGLHSGMCYFDLAKCVEPW